VSLGPGWFEAAAEARRTAKHHLGPVLPFTRVRGEVPVVADGGHAAARVIGRTEET
jgi:hypothetical protein